jgi:hypothetical protein
MMMRGTDVLLPDADHATSNAPLPEASLALIVTAAARRR